VLNDFNANDVKRHLNMEQKGDQIFEYNAKEPYKRDDILQKRPTHGTNRRPNL